MGGLLSQNRHNIVVDLPSFFKINYRINSGYRLHPMKNKEMGGVPIPGIDRRVMHCGVQGFEPGSVQGGDIPWCFNHK
jgi:hypothetical protein